MLQYMTTATKRAQLKSTLHPASQVNRRDIANCDLKAFLGLFKDYGENQDMKGAPTFLRIGNKSQ